MTDRSGRDAFVLKLSAERVAHVLFSTYFGGSGEDETTGIAVRGSQVYITGSTTSSDLPVLSVGLIKTTSAFQGNQPGSDAFVAKLDEGGSNGRVRILYSTYLGGSSEDFGGASPSMATAMPTSRARLNPPTFQPRVLCHCWEPSTERF